MLFLVEVADTSLTYDRESKIPLYALYAIPEVWLVDLNGAAVEVHRGPTADGYVEVTRHEDLAAVVTSRALPRVELAVGTILGR